MQILTNNERKESVLNLLRKTRVEISPDSYTLIALSHEDWRKLLENSELSPRMTAPFMIFSDKYEVTMLLDEIDFGTMRHAVRDARVERGFRLLTFDIHLDFSVVGFLAEVSRILSEADISIVALSAFSRDHLLIKQEDLAKTLKTLSNYVEELC